MKDCTTCGYAVSKGPNYKDFRCAYCLEDDLDVVVGELDRLQKAMQDINHWCNKNVTRTLDIEDWRELCLLLKPWEE
jgi:hypothetical protein